MMSSPTVETRCTRADLRQSSLHTRTTRKSLSKPKWELIHTGSDAAGKTNEANWMGFPCTRCHREVTQQLLASISTVLILPMCFRPRQKPRTKPKTKDTARIDETIAYSRSEYSACIPCVNRFLLDSENRSMNFNTTCSVMRYKREWFQVTDSFEYCSSRMPPAPGTRVLSQVYDTWPNWYSTKMHLGSRGQSPMARAPNGDPAPEPLPASASGQKWSCYPRSCGEDDEDHCPRFQE